jgi:phosphate transport system substrate-binding protein
MKGKFLNRRILVVLTLGLVIGTSLFGCTSNPESEGNSSSSAYIQNKGSDTLVNLALAWAEAYQVIHPDISISVTGGGSGTGIASMINGTLDIANASRQISEDELAQAKANGLDPVEFVVARDAIAVIVNPSNPVNQLTLEQISAIYKGEITNWQEVGGEDRPIVRLSRESNSGTHVYFLETVVRLGSKTDKSIFSPNTLLLPSSEGIIAEVSDNPNAIGYDGLGYITPDVKVLGVAPTADDPFILPSVETVNSGTYPVARDLYMYTGHAPTGIVKEYLDWIVSADAQKIVANLGFVPILMSDVTPTSP